MIAATTGLGIRATAVNADCSGAGALDHVGVGHVGHLLDVGAGREDPLAAVDHDRLDVVALGRLGRGGADLLLHLHVERVHLRPVEPDRADAVGDLEPHELRHGCLSRRLRVSTSSTDAAPALCRASDTMSRVTPGTWSRPRRDAPPVWPGRTWPLGVDLARGGDQLRGPRARGDRGVGLPLRRRRTPRRGTQLTERVARHLARRDPGRRARHALRLPGRRPVGSPTLGLRFNPDKLLLDPYARAVSGELVARPGDLRLRRRRAPDSRRPPRLRAVRPAERGRPRPDFDWGDDQRPCTPVARHRHLRAARQGHDRAARPGARAAARHVRRAGARRRSSTTCATSA